MRALIPLFALLAAARASETGPVRLYPGYITRIQCEGRLLISAVGNDALVRLEALPKELGCGVLLKPAVGAGRTNLVLETSTGTIERLLEVEPVKAQPRGSDLRYFLKGGAQ